VSGEPKSEALDMALSYARATTPAQRANVQRFFSAPENRQHAHLLVAAQKLPRGISPQERENLLREKLRNVR
jgi:hypothetical protein